MTKIRSIIAQLPLRHEPQAWFAFRTMYKREKVIDARLKEAGMTCYVPLRTTVSHYKSKTVVRHIPFFPNYIFVKINGANYTDVLDDPDVFEIIKFQGEVGRVKDAEIEFLQAVLKDQDRYNPTVVNRFADGEEVIISGGALAGKKGEVVHAQNGNNFLVELKGLGLSFQISVAKENLTLNKD